MTNNVLSDDLVNKIDRIAEIAEHVRDLNAEKSRLTAEVIAATGADDTLPAGTLPFVDEEGSVRMNVKVAEELKVNHSGAVEILPALKKAKLLGTVVSQEFKIDKRMFDKLDGADKVLLQKFVTVQKKKPTLEIK